MSARSGEGPMLVVAGCALVGVTIGYAGVAIAAALAVAAVVLLLARLLGAWTVPIAVFLVAAVPSGTFADPHVSLAAGGASVLVTEIAVVVALVAAVVSVGSGRASSRPTARLLFWLWVAAVVVGCVTGLVLENSASALLQDLRPLLVYSGFPIAWALCDERTSQRVEWALLLGCATVSAFSLIIVSTGFMESTFMTDSGRVWFRNGALYPLVIPLGLLMLRRASGRAQNALIVFALALSLAGCAASGTRSYWVSTGLAVAVLVMPRFVQLRRRHQLALAAILAAVVVAVAIPSLATDVSTQRSLGATRLGARVATFGNLSADSSLGTRWRNFVITNKVLAESPLFGKGMGSRVVLVGSGWRVYSAAGQYVDNVPQTVALKTGALGLLAIAALWFYAVLNGCGRRRTAASATLRTALIYASPGLFVLGLTSSYLMTYSPVFALAVVAGIVTRNEAAEAGPCGIPGELS